LSTAAADAILLVHAAFVIFVVAGLPAIWIGVALGRPFAFNRWFRGMHLAAIAFVVVESLLGYLCPLTIWEDALRGTQSDQGFIQRWVHAWLFWRAPAWVFTAVYAVFGLMVAATWWRWPPNRAREPSPPPR
jgi:hypothetical protein